MGMIGAPRLWARAQFRRAWAGLVFVGILSGLGTAVVIVAVAGASRTGSAVDRAIEAASTPTARVQSDDHEAMMRLRSIPGVLLVQSVETYPARVDGVESDFTVFAGPSGYGSAVNRADLRTGRLPEEGAPDELMVTPATADLMHVQVGDVIEVQALT